LALTIVRASIIPLSRSSTDIARKVSPPPVYAVNLYTKYGIYNYFYLS